MVAAIAATLVTLVGTEDAQRANESAYTEFQFHASSIARSPDSIQALAIVTHMLAPRTPSADEAAIKRPGSAGVSMTRLEPALAGMHRRHQIIKKALEEADFGSAREAFAGYSDYTRAVHDACVQFINTFAALLLRDAGVFSSSSFFEPLWAAGGLPPKEIAAFLAAHIRSHFSGEGRGGGVEVIEDEEKYRLVFDACGSGGAMRRRLW